jgi:hypothetical protein
MTTCDIIKWTLAAAYAVALLLRISSAWGWIGAEHSLSAVLLIPLGLPWNRFIDYFSETHPAVLTVLAPAFNLAILFSICSTLRRRRKRA